MDESVAGHGVAAGVRPSPDEVGEAAAGFLDEDQWRGEIPGRELGLEHRFAGALADQGITPEVGETTVAPGRFHHGVETSLFASR